MRFTKKCVVVAIMGIMVAIAADHEANAGVIGHGAAQISRDEITGPGVRTVYMDDLPEVWTPEPPRICQPFCMGIEFWVQSAGQCLQALPITSAQMARGRTGRMLPIR